MQRSCVSLTVGWGTYRVSAGAPHSRNDMRARSRACLPEREATGAREAMAWAYSGGYKEKVGWAMAPLGGASADGLAAPLLARRMPGSVLSPGFDFGARTATLVAIACLS